MIVLGPEGIYFEGVCANYRHPAPRRGVPRFCSAQLGAFPLIKCFGPLGDQIEDWDLHFGCQDPDLSKNIRTPATSNQMHLSGDALEAWH